ncbi:protein ROS1-like [Forsythia ovata]|uniref:Protein ROS1-like n=1 Tax=Forsythia ovata TaxID=205694 RepID=A0ABD1VFP3_9LAMI
MVKLVIERLERLHISNECNQLVKRDKKTHSELIPYNGKLDPLKRRKPPPPKVDFDRETMIICNLLMENDGSEVREEVDKDNAKSRKEREMFCGRTDTFIARMHAIQGNRRFSRWGGSVVDSVVGVYLTQNVSDNCSSSAFMSLAASFPPVSKDTDCKENIVCGHKSVNIEEPQIPENKEQSYVYPTEQDMGYQFVENGESHIFSTGKAVPGSMEDEVIVKDAVQGFPDASRDENLTNISASCSTDKSTTYREFLLLEEINFLQQFCGPQDRKISCQESFGELQSMKDAFSSDTSGLNGTCALHSSASLPHFDDNLDSVHHVGDEVIVKDAVQGFPDASRDENLTNISASCSTDKSTTYRESLLLEEINFLQQFCGHQDGKISCQESFGELQSMKDAFSSNTSGLNGTRALHSSASLPHFDDNLDSVHHVGDEVIVKDAVQGFPDASRDENLTNISASCSTDKSTTYRELLLLEEINFLQQFCGPQDGKISCQESFGELQSMKDAFSSDTSGLNGTRALHSYASLPHFDDNLDSVHHVGDEVIVKDAVQGFPDASRDENLTNISASCSTDKSTTYRELLLLEEINFLQQFCGPQDGKISCQESFGELQSMKDAFSSDTSGLNGTRALHSNASLPHFDDNLDSVHHVGVSGYGRMEESSDISNLDQRNYFKSETVIREKDTQRIQEPLIDQMSSSSKFHEAVMTKKNSFCGSKSPAVVNPNDYQGINNANNYHDGNKTSSRSESTSGRKKGKVEPETQIDWDALRKTYSDSRSKNTTGSIDSANWEAVRKASVEEVAKVIAARGMNNILAGRIKDFLDRIVKDHGSIDLEWLRNVPPDKAKEYLLSIPGLGLKSVECLRLLTLHHVAFPVDTNVGRIVVRLGWVPLQPLPEDVQIHLLNQYPLVDAIQKYLWPRLCTLDQQTLYQLHYQMITFGKVFCTKKKPNCNACPMRGECRHFASAFASARLRLPGPQGKHIIISEAPVPADQDPVRHRSLKLLPVSDGDFLEVRYESRNCEPIVEVPASPEPISSETPVRDIEDFGYESEDEIPIIRLNAEKFQENLRNFMEKTSFSHQESDMSKALVPLSPEATSIPVPKLKDIHRLRTVHQVYELPDLHPLLVEFEKREPDDPSPYLLRTWTTDEMASSSQQSRKRGNTQDATPCDACFSGDMVQEQNDQTVKGTILIPCRTATRGTFPLNGTYFQVNEVFADHKSSRCPIAVPRESIWNLKKRSLYCGKSATSIFKGMSTEEIQFCFWKAFVCVRGVDRVTRDARPLSIKFHPSKNKHADDEE